MNRLRIFSESIIEKSPLRKINSYNNKSYSHYVASEVSNILNTRSRDIIELTKYSGQNRLSFLHFLAEKFNITNFNKPKIEREDPKIIKEIFKQVEKPNSLHINLMDRYTGSLTSLGKIFAATNNQRNRLKFAVKINDEILAKHNNENNKNLILDLLESHNSQEYVKNYKDYKSYLNLNINNPNSVKELDELVESGKYNAPKFNKLYSEYQNMSKFPFEETKDFNKQMYATNFNKLGNKLMSHLARHFFYTKEILESGEAKELAEMYKTTTVQNYKLRNTIISKFPNRYYSDNNDEKLMAEYNKLFKTIENDKSAREFAVYFINKGVEYFHTKEVNEILDNIPHKKLNLFKNNAIKIIYQSDKKNRIEMLQKHIEEPFFETRETTRRRIDSEKYGYNKPLNLFKKTYNKFLNNIRVRIYHNIYAPKEISPKIPSNKTNNNMLNNMMDVKNDILETETLKAQVRAKIEPVATEPIKQDKTKVPQKDIDKTIKVINDVKNKTNTTLFDILEGIKLHATKKQEVKQTTKTEVPTSISNKPLEIVNGIKNKTNNTLLNIVDSIKSNAKKVAKEKRIAKKEEIKSNILNIAKNKLGNKTYAKQKREFIIKSAKMRLDLLPEMFASINETRQIDRKIGLKTPRSANSDVLTLYEMINGSNKKYINYLLKIRNKENNRIFDVKDIIKIIENTEKQIILNKQTNPKYKSSDARKFYNSLQEEKVQEYGKVKHSHKYSAKA